MTGVLNAIVGMARGFAYTVTIGSFPSSQFGYSEGTAGSISPVPSYSGAAIILLSSQTLGNNVVVTLSGVRAQSFFRGIEFQTTSGSLITFLTSGVSSHSNDGTNTFWSWTGLASVPWTATTPSPRSVRIF